MKKGRRYIEPMLGAGDKDVKKRDIKKLRREAGKSFDGNIVSLSQYKNYMGLE